MPKLLTNNRDACFPSWNLDDSHTIAIRVSLGGRVQGFGVRPAIARLAQEFKLTGFVGNSTGGVCIHVEGAASEVLAFLAVLGERLPAGAQIESQSDQSVPPIGTTSFRIESSLSDGPLAARVPCDVAACARCLAEVKSNDNRRRGYAFTTCTECGPRYSLIESMPYDRAATDMNRFTPCPKCDEEYSRATDRRFHSQTNGCEACGPRLWLSAPDGRIVARGESALSAAVLELHRGRILAVRGIGGYQLVVDACSSSAVRELRRRKGRLGKPLAVMVADSAAAERCALLDEAERQSLLSMANPIVVLKSRNTSLVTSEVTEGLDTIGLMLPTTPLHDELARRFQRPLAVTSGNREGEPLAFEPNTGTSELSGVADVWLEHDRSIVRPIDDSVVRVIAGRSATLRLARGLAPLPLALQTVPMLALGGHQKAAIALSNGVQSVLGPHVGDLETESSRARYLDHIKAMCQLYGTMPELLVHDQHPDYFSSRLAAERATATMTVQHHHAHVAAGMLEANWLDREVLGVAWDGTGYGPDGVIWGGEFLVATATAYRRAACLRPFALPGGAMAVREPWRVAVSLVYQAIGAEQASKLRFAGVAAKSVDNIVQMLDKSRMCPITTSAGRLFDGVAALALNIPAAHFEGELAMLLEAACEPTSEGEYLLPLTADKPVQLDWRPLIREVLVDCSGGLAPGRIAMRFHRALAAGIALATELFLELPVVLCGGCFQNKILTELVAERIQEGRPVTTPGVIPCGDGGLAAGQLAIAAARIAGGWQPCA
jgi:hydrogenase maturation protein HypF